MAEQYGPQIPWVYWTDLFGTRNLYYFSPHSYAPFREDNLFLSAWDATSFHAGEKATYNLITSPFVTALTLACFLKGVCSHPFLLYQAALRNHLLLVFRLPCSLISLQVMVFFITTRHANPAPDSFLTISFDNSLLVDDFINEFSVDVF